MEERLGQHGVAVLAPFALFDPDHHARTIDVGELERDHLGRAQARPIGHAERRPVFEPRGRIEKTRDLLGAQHDRQLARLAQGGHTLVRIVPAQRHA